MSTRAAASSLPHISSTLYSSPWVRLLHSPPVELSEPCQHIYHLHHPKITTRRRFITSSYLATPRSASAGADIRRQGLHESPWLSQSPSLASLVYMVHVMIPRENDKQSSHFVRNKRLSWVVSILSWRRVTYSSTPIVMNKNWEYR